ncbi:MAG: EAL domain-containing protein [Betaproteobacteria bacterium]|nr:EAL domain-containing protein [Betaproteobacteria bacterium]MDE2151288.1 EAL domain-containing protein [Betaproteobacteria bacterium]MDE2479271.1 EAL domain-containing protein [Betaproteobacteria bacterium]
MNELLDDPLADLLRESEALLRGLLGNAMVGMYLGQDGRFVYVNPWLAGLFGYSQQELCAGMGPLDLTAQESRERVGEEIERRTRGEVPSSHYGFKALHRDGSTFEVEVFGVATRLGGRPAVIGILHDISARERAARALADQLRLTETLIETIPGPLFYKDERGIYLGCNRAFEAFLRRPREQIVGKSVYEVAPKELADVYYAADDWLFRHPGTQTYETVVENAQGERRDVVFYKATFDKADGSLGGLLGVILDITERKELERRVWEQAHHDALTGLPNMRRLRERLAAAVELARRRRDKGLALLFIDLDRFKEVNDTLGHAAGDKLLVDAAGRLRGALRASDLVGRQGGDEFLILLDDLETEEQAEQVAAKVVEVLSRPFVLEGQEVRLSASVGIALAPQDAQDVETLIRFADLAMYAAKGAGRAGYRRFSREMQEQVARRRAVGEALRRALELGQLDVHYQPIVELGSGRVDKAEALLRWTHPGLGAVSPAEFLPIAAEVGVLEAVSEWFMEQALRAMREGSSARPGRPLQVAINLSPRQLAGGACEAWLSALRGAALSPGLLAVEVTEETLQDGGSAVLRGLHALRAAGIDIGLDDFGSGHSAFSHLRDRLVSHIKIDSSLVCALSSEPNGHVIVDALIAMAHTLGLRVTAEGVETEAQRELLAQGGCDFAQGLLLGEPMPLPELLEFIARR